MNLKLAVAVAKAKSNTRKRNAAKVKAEHDAERAREALIKDITSSITLPEPIRGENGRDAPTISEIMEQVKPLLPSKIEDVRITQGVQLSQVQAMLDAQLPEIQKEDRPKVEVIREELDMEQLGEYVTKKDFDDALRRVQDAITASQSGGSRVRELANVIEVNSDVTITSKQLIDNQINIVLVMAAGITVTLPAPDATRIVWVQQGYTGTGTFQVCRT